MALNESYRRILARLGYYDYQHGFIFRHLNQGEGWNSHLEKCRSFIMKAIEMNNPEKVTVLGSGWLLELPLSEMVEKVNKICLIDVVHPPEVMKQVSAIGGVEVKTEDLTGGLIDEIWRKSSIIPFYRKLKSIDNIIVPEYIPDHDPGMIISLNLLSQLETLPVRHLRKKSFTDEEAINSFRKEIQNKHIQFLKKFRSVLITDIAEVFTDQSGIVTEKETVIADLPSGIHREDWTWDFDAKGSDYYRKKSFFKVAAIII